MSDFNLTGTLVVEEDIPYTSFINYKINDEKASYNIDDLSNLSYTVNKKELNGTNFSYESIIEATVNVVKYNVDESKIKLVQRYPSDVEVFLEPSLGIQSDSEVFKEIASSIIGDETNPFKKAKLIFDYTYTVMNYDESTGNKTALDAVNTKIGVCTDYARLMVAILRAEGIPSRTISGFKIPTHLDEVDLNKEEYNHMWVEFYLEEYGWIPADPTISFSNEKFITDRNFAELTEYYIPLTIDIPIQKEYEYMIKSGETPNFTVNLNKTGFLSEISKK